MLGHDFTVGGGRARVNAAGMGTAKDAKDAKSAKDF